MELSKYKDEVSHLNGLILPPKGMADVVLDTDTYNEIDDQFALSMLLLSEKKLRTAAIYAAPFHNEKSDGPEDGMEKSYQEILKVLDLCGKAELEPVVFKGSRTYLSDEKTPVISEAALDLSRRAMNYSSENPLWVVAIGAITNVASAILMNPEISEKIVVVWLGGNSYDLPGTKEFNMMQDIPAARVVIEKSRLVILPCLGVVSEFRVSKPELERWLLGKNPLADYLARNTIEEAERQSDLLCWSRVIWDVTAVAWLLNENGKYMRCVSRPAQLPGYDRAYHGETIGKELTYVSYINRDRLLTDLVKLLTDDNPAKLTEGG